MGKMKEIVNQFRVGFVEPSVRAQKLLKILSTNKKALEIAGPVLYHKLVFEYQFVLSQRKHYVEIDFKYCPKFR